MDTSNMIFTFGSNLAGRHGAGAARYALQFKGAAYGQGEGHYGISYALPTKGWKIDFIPLNEIQMYVDNFIAYAKKHLQFKFQVTRVGCGLAGYKDKDIAPMFKDAPDNCYFDEAWKPYLGDEYEYWGTK